MHKIQILWKFTKLQEETINPMGNLVISRNGCHNLMTIMFRLIISSNPALHIRTNTDNFYGDVGIGVQQWLLFTKFIYVLRQFFSIRSRHELITNVHLRALQIWDKRDWDVFWSYLWKSWKAIKFWVCSFGTSHRVVCVLWACRRRHSSTC